jgi:hypothetical protein
VRSDLYLRLVACGDGPFEAAWGHTPDNPAEIRRGSVVLRAPGRRRCFASVLEVHPGSPAVSAVELAGERGVRVLFHEGQPREYAAPAPDA